jgi:flagellum-specific peptidoglycan hydrolase FlgJ
MPQATDTLMNPLIQMESTSKFGFREHPTKHERRFHEGRDYEAAIGTSVKAADSGVAHIHQDLNGYGNYIVIDHGNGWYTRYAHLSQFSIKDGQTVSQGQEIAKSGNTGIGTGAHLHFEIRHGSEFGQPLDPKYYLGQNYIQQGIIPEANSAVSLGDGGDRSHGIFAVKQLQSMLKELGYDLGTSGLNHDGVDGSYGGATLTSVNDFKSKHSLLVDTKGLVDSKTWQVLGDSVRQRNAGQVESTTQSPVTSPSPIPIITSSPTPLSKSISHTGNTFIDSVSADAVCSQQVTGVPASVTLAQAILESGWGKSSLAREGNNFFGIKGQGPAGSINLPTQEYINGQSVTVNAPFRKYNHAEESFTDHGRFFLENRRYATAIQHTDNAQQFAREIAKAGYATDPNYANKLNALIKEYDLSRFDQIGRLESSMQTRNFVQASQTILDKRGHLEGDTQVYRGYTYTFQKQADTLTAHKHGQEILKQVGTQVFVDRVTPSDVKVLNTVTQNLEKLDQQTKDFSKASQTILDQRGHSENGTQVFKGNIYSFEKTGDTLTVHKQDREIFKQVGNQVVNSQVTAQDVGILSSVAQTLEDKEKNVSQKISQSQTPVGAGLER